MATGIIPANLIPFRRPNNDGTPQRTPIRFAQGVQLLGRDEFLDRLEVLGEVGPNSPLSFLLVRLRTRDTRPCGAARTEQGLVQALGLQAVHLLRPTDALGTWSGNSLAVALQGAGATASAAVAARLSHHMNQRLDDEAPGFEVVVYAATGIGANAMVLPSAALAE